MLSAELVELPQLCDPSDSITISFRLKELPVSHLDSEGLELAADVGGRAHSDSPLLASRISPSTRALKPILYCAASKVSFESGVGNVNVNDAPAKDTKDARRLS